MNDVKNPSSSFIVPSFFVHRCSSRRYCLLTPCRDEAQFARRTLDSVLAQTILPTLWILIDDGSTDDTPAILGEYAARHSFIRIIRRENRGYRKLGGGVIDAFYEGFNTIDPRAFDYLCKFDLDLELPPRYFETLMELMERDPRLGSLSGKPYFHFKGRYLPEKCGDENSVGMCKFYRVACFRQIGGFVRELMWDGIDGHRCRMLGWRCASLDLPELRFTHLRPMGTSHKSWWTGRVRHGYGQYFMGTGPVYLTASALSRLARPPRVLGSLAICWGYYKAMLQRQPRYDDREFRRFLRRYQRSCLLMGKRRATALLDSRDRMETQMNADKHG